jgi:hypothetical protein
MTGATAEVRAAKSGRAADQGDVRVSWRGDGRDGRNDSKGKFPGRRACAGCGRAEMLAAYA